MEHLIDKRADQAQRMIRRNTLFGRYVAEHDWTELCLFLSYRTSNTAHRTAPVLCRLLFSNLLRSQVQRGDTKESSYSA